jgi:outer membrane protein assembly factor BamD (BamD/ComL family)
MAEKKENTSSDANERLKIWLGLVKFCFAVFFICVTLIKINHEKMKARIEIAELENGSCDGDDESESGQDEAKRLYYQGVDAYTKNDLNGAIQAWEKVLKLDPDHAEAKKFLERAKAKQKALEGNRK